MSQRFPPIALFAWLCASLYYFYQYALRSAPSVMLPQLSDAFGVGAVGVASIVGLFYYGYSPFSLVAGAALDRFGAKRVVPIGAALVGAGCFLFASDNATVAGAGRFLQGAGGVFALLGAIYIATKYFPPAYAATFAGATQMFGMAGGTAGQIALGPAMSGGMSTTTFWTMAAIPGLLLGIVLFAVLPKDESPGTARQGGIKAAVAPLARVFANPQSILCGLIAGLLFIPTSIFDMTWGVRFLEEGRGREYEDAVRIAATVPFGWMFGCPLLGVLSDRMGRRRPVVLVSAFVMLVTMAWALFGIAGVVPGGVIGFVLGFASGATMIMYTIIKEANPPEVSGSATGVVNFLNFTFSALLGPVFGSRLVAASGGSETLALEHFQAAFQPMIAGIAIAIVLTLLLKETGTAARSAGAPPSAVPATDTAAR